ARSIDLLEDSAAECGNTFRMSRRGYVFATADEAQAQRLHATAIQVSEHGMGTVRVHPGPDEYHSARAEGYADQPVGADVLRGDEVHRVYPYLAPDTVAALHIRRAGWVNAVALGSWFLKQAIAAGATFVRGRVTRVVTTGGAVREVQLGSGESFSTDRFV